MHDLSSLFAVFTIILTVEVKGNADVIKLSCSPGWSLYLSSCSTMQLRICLLSPRCDSSPLYPFIHLAHVVQRMDNAIHWVSLILSKFPTLLAQRENLLVPDYWTRLISSPGYWFILWIALSNVWTTGAWLKWGLVKIKWLAQKHNTKTNSDLPIWNPRH